jgi:Tol biopolymer transport system component
MVEGDINPFEGNSIDFSWSPNGEMIAYAFSEDNKLYVMNSDGSSRKLVLDDGDLLFSWYPDSRHLGIIKREPGHKDQFLEIDICNLETRTILEGEKLSLLLWQPKR